MKEKKRLEKLLRDINAGDEEDFRQDLETIEEWWPDDMNDWFIFLDIYGPYKKVLDKTEKKV